LLNPQTFSYRVRPANKGSPVAGVSHRGQSNHVKELWTARPAFIPVVGKAFNFLEATVKNPAPVIEDINFYAASRMKGYDSMSKENRDVRKQELVRVRGTPVFFKEKDEKTC
jgi:hypothetical protein